MEAVTLIYYIQNTVCKLTIINMVNKANFELIKYIFIAPGIMMKMQEQACFTLMVVARITIITF